jgi:hypothetical protein
MVNLFLIVDDNLLSSWFVVIALSLILWRFQILKMNI